MLTMEASRNMQTVSPLIKLVKVTHPILFRSMISLSDFGSDIWAGLHYKFSDPREHSIWGVLTLLFIWMPGFMLGADLLWTFIRNYLKEQSGKRSKVDIESNILMPIALEV